MSTQSANEQLLAENAELRARLEEAEDALRAIQSGEVDALVVAGPNGPQIFALQGVDAESNRFRGDIIAQISDAVVAVDEERRVTYLNAAAERQYGTSISEALGKSVRALWSNRWLRDLDQAAVEAILLEKDSWRGETVHVRPDGVEIPVESAVIRLRDATGAPAGFLATIRDISDRKLSEKARAESERRLRAIYDGTHNYIGLLTPDGTLIEANRASLEFASSKLEDVVGRPFWETVWFQFTPGAPDVIRAAVQRAAAGEFVRFEAAINTPTGETREFDISFAPIRDEQGEIVLIVPEGLDITARKQSESALGVSEEKYRNLIEALPAAVYTCDHEGRIQIYNAAAVELWGRAPVVGKDLWCGSWRIYQPDGSPLELDTCPMARTLKDGSAVRGEEIVVERPDGSRRHVLPYPDPIFDADGKLVGAVNMLLDITERKQMETLLRAAKESAEMANQSKDHFLAVLSHELRTPLTPVLMMIAALEHDPELRPDVREDLSMMRRNIELETKLIDDLLDLNRVTSGKLALEIEPIDLNEAVRHVSGICHPQLRERGIHLDLALDDAAGLVAADTARLQQVLWNVLKNAIKFTPEQGTIRIATKRLNAARCEVRITDSGMGIAPEVLPRIFNAFEQGNSNITRQFGGLGLGLAICKALIALHRGSIRAESAGLGHGATFVVELPGKAPEAVSKPHHDGAQLPNGKPPQLRLLVVEDHADTARILGRLLRAEGFAVLTASDVAGATALAEREPFDLLVTDLGLPDGTGYDVMRAVRPIRTVPGIAMSGYGMDEDVRRSREAGFTEHLVKPIDVTQLIEAIRRVAKDRS